MKLFYVFFANVVFCLLSNSVSAQSRGVFLKADELTKNAGSQSDQRYRDYAEVINFQFGAEHPVSLVNHRFEGDTPSFREISFTLVNNISSNPFRRYLMNAEIIDNIELVSLQTLDQSITAVVYKVELREVMITSATTMLDQDGVPIDNLTATFKAARITTYSPDIRGGYSANPPFTFNQDTQSDNFN